MYHSSDRFLTEGQAQVVASRTNRSFLLGARFGLTGGVGQLALNSLLMLLGIEELSREREAVGRVGDIDAADTNGGGRRKVKAEKECSRPVGNTSASPMRSGTGGQLRRTRPERGPLELDRSDDSRAERFRHGNIPMES